MNLHKISFIHSEIYQQTNSALHSKTNDMQRKSIMNSVKKKGIF